MTISSIVAADENNAIGKDNQIPWHLPDDLKFFKKTTMGKPILMGRKTYESLGKPLPGRLNIVVSRSKKTGLPNSVLLYDDLEKALKRMKAENTEEAFIIGGGKIYEQTMDIIDRIYLTKVFTTVDGATAFFPSIDHSQWKLTWEAMHDADEKHAFPFCFQQYDRLVM